MTTKEPKDLNDLLYHFTVLYERMNEEKLAFAKQVVKIDHLVKDFTARMDEFEKNGEKTKSAIAQRVFDAGREVSGKIEERTKDVIRNDFEKNAKEFHETIKKWQVATHHFETSYRETNSRNEILTFVVGIVVCIAIGMGIDRFIAPAPSLPLKDQEIATYNNGKIFDAFWPKLSKKEQERLEAIANGQPVQKNTEESSSQNNVDNQ